MFGSFNDLVVASFFLFVYICPFFAIWMILSYTAKGSGKKKHFARWCFSLALFSAIVYVSILYIAHNWSCFGLPEFRIHGMFIDLHLFCLGPVYSLLLCMGICRAFKGKLRKQLPPEHEDIDVSRLIRLGVVAGHASMSIPIGCVFAG